MNILVVCLHILVCFVLITVILLQAGRGQGLTGGAFGGGNVQSLFGTKTSSFLTKATSVCAILFLFTCIGLNVLEVQKSRSLFRTPDTQAPLDVDQIKKALEKVKEIDPQAAEKTADAVATAETEVSEAVTAAQAESNQPAETAADAPGAPKP